MLNHLETFALGCAGACLVLKLVPGLVLIGLVAGVLVAAGSYAYRKLDKSSPPA